MLPHVVCQIQTQKFRMQPKISYLGIYILNFEWQQRLFLKLLHLQVLQLQQVLVLLFNIFLLYILVYYQPCSFIFKKLLREYCLHYSILICIHQPLYVQFNLLSLIFIFIIAHISLLFPTFLQLKQLSFTLFSNWD